MNPYFERSFSVNCADALDASVHRNLYCVLTGIDEMVAREFEGLSGCLYAIRLVTKGSVMRSMRIALGVAFSVALGAEMIAQQQPPPASPPASNPFDLSAAREAMGATLPTVASVASLEGQALKVFQAGDCKSAVDALDRYAKESNSLSNYIARGLKPYYDGSYDERKTFPGARLSQLVPLEKLGNDYKTKRNRAMVMQAECLVKNGDKLKAAATYYQALGLIDIKDSEWWDRARTGLNALLEVK